MSTILNNSIWPNPDGNLGNNKTAIPDGVNVKWPEGDALIHNFVYKDGKLVGFVDTKALIENDSKTTVFPYDFVDITVDKRLETLMTFNAGERCKRLNVKYDIFLPKGYKRLEYLESTGTQYIDTGVKLSNESEVTCEFSGQDVSINSKLYGAENNGAVPMFRVYAPVEGNIVFYCGGTNRIAFGTYKMEANVRYSVVQNNEFVLTNGVKSTNPSPETNWETLYTSALFGCKPTQQNIQIYNGGRIYSFTISRTGEMQLNLIPCLNDTGTPCMYDIISQEPLYNKGAGQFLYPGAESQVVTSDLDEIFYAKKTAHGIQKLYHVPENFSGSKDEYAIENGFKQLVEPPMPAEGYWSPQWIETDTQLICNWVEADVPEI